MVYLNISKMLTFSAVKTGRLAMINLKKYILNSVRCFGILFILRPNQQLESLTELRIYKNVLIMF